MAPDCKSGARKRYAGSNPALPKVSKQSHAPERPESNRLRSESNRSLRSLGGQGRGVTPGAPSQKAFQGHDVHVAAVQGTVLLEDADLAESRLAVEPLAVLIAVERVQHDLVEAALSSSLR